MSSQVAIPTIRDNTEVLFLNLLSVLFMNFLHSCNVFIGNISLPIQVAYRRIYLSISKSWRFLFFSNLSLFIVAIVKHRC